MQLFSKDLLDFLPVNFRYVRLIKSQKTEIYQFRLNESEFYQSKYSTCSSPNKKISKIINYESEGFSSL